MFGQSNNTSFAFKPAAQSSPFSQSAFGNPIATTSFGTSTAPVFGGGNPLFSSKPAGATTNNLFGQTTAAPTFGQPATTQPSFGAFANTNTNTSLFGAQQNANPNLFGNPAPSFGQANKSSSFGFGSTPGTGIFGQTQQPAQQIVPFGQPTAAAGAGVFGNTAGFGGASAGTGMTGTYAKFAPVTGSDTMVKNSVTQTISTRHHCITCMKEYENKSLEELRLEDYVAGRKGTAQTQTSGLFGNTSAAPSTGFPPMNNSFGSVAQTTGTGLFAKSSYIPPATTTSSFAFNTASTPSLFGSSTQAKPFGSAPTSLFPTANTQPTNTFGTMNSSQTTGFGTGFAAAQPNQNIGLFNQNKPAFSSPATTGMPFGTTSFTSTNTGAGMFGQNKTTATPGFGATPSFAAPATNTFGQTPGFNANQSNNTLFNASFNKPAGTTSAFSFGANPGTATVLGTNAGIGMGGATGLFGQPKTGGLFGTTNPTPYNNTGTFGTAPLFGTNTNSMPSLGTGMFGGLGTNQQQLSSGSVHQQILALVAAPYGDSPLLKNLLPASGKTEELLKPTNPARRTLNSPQYKVSLNDSLPKVKAKPINASQLSKKSLFEGLEEEDPYLMEAFRPRPNVKRLVLRPKSSPNLSDLQASKKNMSIAPNLNSPEKVDNAEVSKNNDGEAVNKENEIFEKRASLGERRSSSAWLKTAIPRTTENTDFVNQQSPFRGSEIPEENLENTVAELRPQASKQNLSQFVSNDLTLSPNVTLGMERTADYTGDSDSSQKSGDYPEWKPNAAKVKLQRSGYYTIPPLDTLDDLVRGETCVVPNFTIGRSGYGNVYFPDSIDIYGMDLDEIVHFRNKEVVIYPDDKLKPPIGEGLNRPAQITLDCVWPVDKSLHKPIKDTHRLAEMDYEGKLRRVSAKHKTPFLEYRPETGSWVFKVQHFSKYGLDESDDDDDAPATNADKRNIRLDHRQILLLGGDEAVGKKQKIMSGLNGTVKDRSTDVSSEHDFVEHEEAMEDEMSQFVLPFEDYGHRKQTVLSPSSMYARIIGTDSHKLQLMKASFFDANEEEMEDAVCEGMQQLLQEDEMIDVDVLMDDSHTHPLKQLPLTRYHVKLQTDSALLGNNFYQDTEVAALRKKISDPIIKASLGVWKFFPAPIVQPQTVVLKYKSEVIPFKDSVINKLRSRCVADAGVQMGRKFRPSWGPGLTLISLNSQEQASLMPLQNSISQLGYYVSGRSCDDTSSMSIVQRLQILGGRGKNQHSFQESIEGHLRIQLDHCIMGQDGDCPLIAVQTGESGIAALHAHYNLAQELVDKSDSFSVYTSNVFKLCTALWGQLPDIELTDDEKDHKCVMVRKEALGEWLRNVAESNIREEIAQLDNDEQIILSLLSANKLEEACALARKNGDYCMALFISQMEGTMGVRELVKQQLALWQETFVDENLSIERLKVFMLVAGEPLIYSKDSTINVCERLDWKRALALHLWYLSPPTASIADALELYESSFDNKSVDPYAVKPRPDYFDVNYDAQAEDENSIYDLCFHLLKLYCTGNHPLEVLLNTMTHTLDPVDYRLSWLMQQTLAALGYSHLSDFGIALLHTNFADQLETSGMWHWAVFVLLHLEDTGRRRYAINELLSRHVELSEEPDYVSRENFMKEELGIPSIWINKAKAVKALAMKRYGEAAWHLIQAEQWDQAHEVIVEYLAADAIINENYDYLKSLLSPLISSECYDAINGWSNQGQLLWDYMAVTDEIEALRKFPDISQFGYKLELLQPQLTLLCTKIDQFPCSTAKQRLCQAEISKRTFQLARSLLLLKSDDNASISKTLFNLLSKLPLPEDYEQQDLRFVISARITEMTY